MHQVAVRVRPMNDKERTVSEFETIRVLDGKVLVLVDPEANSEEVSWGVIERFQLGVAEEPREGDAIRLRLRFRLVGTSAGDLRELD
jgi:hypothetical protein